MASLTEHHGGRIIKLMLMGDSGTGKTGALASLVPDYKIGILDFDNGLDILRRAVTKLGKQELFKNVSYHTLTDNFRSTGTRLVPTTATAWPKAIQYLENWGDGWPPIAKWDDSYILVVDSLNYAGRAAMRYIASLNNRLGVAPFQSDFLEAQRLVESLTDMLYADSVKCNVLILTHLKEIGKQIEKLDDKGRVVKITDPDTLKVLPETGTGRALSPVVGRSFNAILQTDVISGRYVIRTRQHGNTPLKNPTLGGVKDILPLETGLAEYFAAVRN